jgi:hypothetical protein
LVGYLACNHCRKRRIILLLVVFPLLLALFLIGFTVVRHVFQRPRRVIERAAPPAATALSSPGVKDRTMPAYEIHARREALSSRIS